MPAKDKLKTISTSKEGENKKVKGSLVSVFCTLQSSISLAMEAQRVHRVAETSVGVAGAFERVAETFE